MKKLILLTAVLAPAFALQAQTVTPNVVASGGDYYQAAQGSVAWTIGEPISETYTSSNILTTGFHQPEASIITMLKEQGFDKQVLVFPNPVRDLLYVNFSGAESGSYALELTDALGRTISKSAAAISESNSRVSLKINEVAPGTYFLRVSNKEFNKTVKIEKVN